MPKNDRIGVDALYHYFLRRLLSFIILSVVLSSIIALLVTANKFNSNLRPQLTESARIVSKEISKNIEYAVSAGVPYDDLRGVDTYFSDLLKQYPQFSGIELIPYEKNKLCIYVDANSVNVTRAKQNIHVHNCSTKPVQLKSIKLSRWGRFKQKTLTAMSGGDEFLKPVESNIMAFGSKIASVSLTLNDKYFTEKMLAISFDAFIILMAVILLVIEIFVVVVTFYHAEPLRQIESTLTSWGNNKFPPIMLKNNGEFRRIIDYLSYCRESLRIRTNRLLARNTSPEFEKELIQFANEKNLTAKFTATRKAMVLDVRLPLFFYLFAEGLQLPFLPLFVKERLVGNEILSLEIMMALPMVLFMVLATFMTTMTTTFIDKIGVRRVFFLGAFFSILGHLGCMLSKDIVVIFLSRASCGLAFGLITMVCQSYIVKITRKQGKAERTKAMVVYVRIMKTSALCAIAIGTILADNFGYTVVFGVAVGISAISLFLAATMLINDDKVPKENKKQRIFTKELLTNKRLMSLLLFSAVSSEIVINGFLYFFIPVYLASIGAGIEKAGYILIIYSLVLIFVSYISAEILIRLDKNFITVVLTTLGSGLVIMGINIASDLMAILNIAIVLAVMHSFMPRSIAIIESVEHLSANSQTAALSLSRIFERIGSVIGPLLMGFLLVSYSAVESVTIIGVIVTVCGLFMCLANISQIQYRSATF